MAAASNFSIEALNLPLLSDPKYVEYFRETKDQNMVTHFYECFKNMNPSKFDKDIHENSKEMLKIIIHQRKEFGERCLAVEEAKNKLDEKMIEMMKENIQLNQKLAQEYVATSTLKTELDSVKERYQRAEKERAELEEKYSISLDTANKWATKSQEKNIELENLKIENEKLRAGLQKIENKYIKEKEEAEMEAHRMKKEKQRVHLRLSKDGFKDGRPDQSSSLLRKQVTTTRKYTQQSAYITSPLITSSPTSPTSIARRQSQTCIRQQQFCTQSSTSIFRRSGLTTSSSSTSTTASMNQQQHYANYPTAFQQQQNRQFMSCFEAAEDFKPPTSQSQSNDKVLSSIPLPLPPPPPQRWITNNSMDHSSLIPMDPFYSSMPEMMPPTTPKFSTPPQQQYYLS